MSMSAEQLTIAIAQCTQAVEAISTCPGFAYQSAQEAVDIIVKQRQGFQYQLDLLDPNSKASRMKRRHEARLASPVPIKEVE